MEHLLPDFAHRLFLVLSDIAIFYYRLYVSLYLRQLSGGNISWGVASGTSVQR
jgi:hypothetical protein